jgi:hypothetical protein
MLAEIDTSILGEIKAEGRPVGVGHLPEIMTKPAQIMERNPVLIA